MLASGDDDAALAHVLEQVQDPELFLTKVREIYGRPEAETEDVIDFKDGRVFERSSRPQRVSGAVVGRCGRSATSRSAEPSSASCPTR